LKFLVDSMLGKLARWLRMLGHDTTYNIKLDDSALLELARKESRTLLTRDLELHQRAIAKGIDSYFINGKTESEHLAEVSKQYDLTLEINMDRSHCPTCNTPLKESPKEKLADEVEKNTFIYYNEFWKCLNCGQIYWQGAHWKQISNTLKQAQQKLEKLKEKIEV